MNAKSLISRILVIDPSKRLTLEQIISHPFMGSKIPKQLPSIALTQPPPRSYNDQTSNNFGTSLSKYQGVNKNVEKTA
jgi:polo-like kinase 1